MTTRVSWEQTHDYHEAWAHCEARSARAGATSYMPDTKVKKEFWAIEIYLVSSRLLT